MDGVRRKERELDSKGGTGGSFISDEKRV